MTFRRLSSLRKDNYRLPCLLLVFKHSLLYQYNPNESLTVLVRDRTLRKPCFRRPYFRYSSNSRRKRARFANDRFWPTSAPFSAAFHVNRAAAFHRKAELLEPLISVLGMHPNGHSRKSRFSLYSDPNYWFLLWPQLFDPNYSKLHISLNYQSTYGNTFQKVIAPGTQPPYS